MLAAPQEQSRRWEAPDRKLPKRVGSGAPLHAVSTRCRSPKEPEPAALRLADRGRWVNREESKEMVPTTGRQSGASARAATEQRLLRGRVRALRLGSARSPRSHDDSGRIAARFERVEDEVEAVLEGGREVVAD